MASHRRRTASSPMCLRSLSDSVSVTSHRSQHPSPVIRQREVSTVVYRYICSALSIEMQSVGVASRYGLLIGGRTCNWGNKSHSWTSQSKVE